MYCPKCGTQNDDNAYKCTTCGIMLQRAAPEKKSNTAVIVVVIVVAGVFVFFAVAGIIAAIAIPAYLDYKVKVQLSAVTIAFDALAEVVMEDHADKGQFLEQNDPFIKEMSLEYGEFSCPARANDHDIIFRFTFNDTISHLNDCTLDMQITYAPDTGYTREWLPTSTLPAKYIPRR